MFVFFGVAPFGTMVLLFRLYIYIWGTRAEVQLCVEQVGLTFKMSFSTRCRYNVYI